MARRKDLRCNRCGELTGWSTADSLPEGRYRCQPCRRIEPQPTGRRTAIKSRDCVGCGSAFDVPQTHPRKKYCSWACFNKSATRTRAIRTDWTERTRRKRREADTPGLTRLQRRRLLREWRRAKSCAYCDRPADTIDHVIPLSRGGTNHEGNLAPCCKSCNSSKSDLLLMEWRLGKPHGGTACWRPWMDADWVSLKPRTRNTERELVMVLDVECPVCATVFTPKSSKNVTCSPACSREWAKRAARNAYRRKMGMPEDWTTPTAPNGVGVKQLRRANVHKAA